MPPSAASSSLRSAGLAFRNAKHQTAKVGAEGSVPERGEAEHDSPARKRSVQGSGDDAG